MNNWIVVSEGKRIRLEEPSGRRALVVIAASTWFEAQAVAKVYLPRHGIEPLWYLSPYEPVGKLRAVNLLVVRAGRVEREVRL